VPNAFLEPLVARIRGSAGDPYCRFISGETETLLTWEDLGASAARFLAAYRTRNLQPGAVILIFLRHTPQLYGSFFGAMLGGFVPSFMPCISPRQIPAVYWASHRTLFEKVRPAAVVADRATIDEMRSNGLGLERIEVIEADDIGSGSPADHQWLVPDALQIGLLQHSSGTTGLKKGVALSYDAIAKQLDSYADSLALRQDDMIVSWLPLYHDMGLVACLLLPTMRGIPFVHLDALEWVAEPAGLLSRLTRHRGTLTWLPNFAFEHLALLAGRRASEFDLSHVRAFINCSEPCKPASFDRFARAFEPSGVRPEQLQCCYAMAETVFAVTQTRLGCAPNRLRVDPSRLGIGDNVAIVTENRPGQDILDVGCPIDGADLWVADRERRPLPDGHVGEIVIRSSFLFNGYNKDPDKTTERLENGAYYSRDLGFRLEGRLYVLGRVDDLIIINGRNLYAHEIEAIVSEIEGLKGGRNVAVPIFDERAGSQALVVIAERRKDANRADEDIRAEILSSIQSVFAVTPKSAHIVQEGWLVKTTSGKISREANLAKLSGGGPGAVR
jgi:fatty-acyl-CoA synthase